METSIKSNFPISNESLFNGVEVNDCDNCPLLFRDDFGLTCSAHGMFSKGFDTEPLMEICALKFTDIVIRLKDISNEN